jgi:hypothetical protein
MLPAHWITMQPQVQSSQGLSSGLTLSSGWRLIVGMYGSCGVVVCSLLSLHIKNAEATQ